MPTQDEIRKQNLLEMAKRRKATLGANNSLAAERAQLDIDRLSKELSQTTVAPTKAVEEKLVETPVLSEEERIAGEADRPFTEVSDTEKKLFGEVQGPTSLESYVDEQKASIERKKESELKKAADTTENIMAQAEGAKMAAGAPLESAKQIYGGVNREGTTDFTRTPGLERFSEISRRQIERVQNRANSALADVESYRQEILRAEKAGNRALADEYRSRLAQAETNVLNAESAYLEAIDLEEKRKAEARKVGIGNLDTILTALGPAGIASLGQEQLAPLLEEAGLSGAFGAAIIESNARLAEAQASGDALQIERAQLENQRLAAQIRELGQDPTQKKFNFYTSILNDPSASLAERAAAREALNLKEGDLIPSTDNIQDAPKGPGSNAILEYAQIFAGSPMNAEGVDFSAPIGTPVNAQLSGEVVFAGENGGWGNRVSIRDNKGNIHTYNHLQNIAVSIGDIIGPGIQIGTVGNTGSVLKADGTPPSAAEKAAGRGAHLDYTVYDPSGNKYSLNEAWQFANGSIQEDFAPSQLAILKSFDGKKIPATWDGTAEEFYEAYDLLEQKRVDPNTPIIEKIALSAGGKELLKDEAQKVAAFEKAVSDVQALESSLNQVTTDQMAPIFGALTKRNPWSKTRKEIESLLVQMTPGLARGVFGEVGVLTDADIDRYKSLLPTLTDTQAQRETLLRMIKDSLLRGTEATLQSAAANNRDVSRYKGMLEYVQEGTGSNQTIDSLNMDYNLYEYGSSTPEEDLWNNL